LSILRGVFFWVWRKTCASDVAGDPAVTSLVLDLVGAIRSGTTAGGAKTDSSCGPRGCHCEGRAASFCPKRRAQRHDEAVRFSGGVLRVADDGGTKTQSTATCLASGRGRSFASNTVSSTLLPLGVHATILLACYFAGSGVQRDVGEASEHHALTPCAASACSSATCTAPSVSLLVPHANTKSLPVGAGAASIPHGDSPRVPIPRGCW
ncbi:trans-sialidase, putative, partial [Trypanosoma cruzi]